MTTSNLFARRILISGSISENHDDATTDNVLKARELIEKLVEILVSKGANFVVPLDAEPSRSCDDLPICFDWLIWKSIDRFSHTRPKDSPSPFVFGVKHQKSAGQIPEEYKEFWNNLRSRGQVELDSANEWNMASFRMEKQARLADILIVLGGSDGVKLLANLFHASGKPVIPLNLPICKANDGALKIYSTCLSSDQTNPPFQLIGNKKPQMWLNEINYNFDLSIENYAKKIIDLLELLDKPHAFAVRMIGDGNDISDIDSHFTNVIEPALEQLGFNLITINKLHNYKHPLVIQEIFSYLQRSSLVIADLTGSRPNCFLELGCALGLAKPTIIMAKEDSDFELPFDLKPIFTYFWDSKKTAEERKSEFKQHWHNTRHRSPIISTPKLIQ